MDTRTDIEWWKPRLPEAAQSTPRPITARVSKISFWALIGFTIVLIMAPQDHFAPLKHLHLAFLFAVIAGATYLVNRFQYGSFTGRRFEFIWGGALLLWAIVTVPFSIWPGGSVNTITNIFLKALIIFWLLGSVVDTPGRLKTMAWILTLISIPLSLSAVHTFASGGFGGTGRISGYVGGLTANPNDLAVMLNLIFSLTVGLIFCTRRLSLRVILALLAVFDMLAVMATYSRGGFLMLATILLAFGVCLWRRGAWLPIVIFLAIAAIAVPATSMMHGSYINRLSTITSVQSDKTGSAEARLQGMEDATTYTMHHPLIGAGIGNSMLALNKMRTQDRWHLVHDIYLRYAMELGLPGLILFLLLFYSSLKSAWGARKVAKTRPDQQDLYFLAEAIGISLVGYIVGGAFQPSAYQFFFYYFAGLAVATGVIATRITSQEGASQDKVMNQSR
jgi:O-antigen ligase